MGIFGRATRKQVPAVVMPTLTLSGGRLSHLEQIGTTTRRTRLFGECVRRLVSHPLVQTSMSGTPVGDGAGMEELVSIVKPVFTHDRSLARWVANRGAVAFLYGQYVERGTPASGRMHMLRVMGIDLTPDGSPRAFERSDQSALTEDAKSAVVGLFVSLSSRLDQYPSFEVATIQDLNNDPGFCISEAMAYDYIAWVAALALRDQVTENLVAVPEPAAFAGPGWYTEPIFAKSERYWDCDWSERCRVPGQADEISLPLA